MAPAGQPGRGERQPDRRREIAAAAQRVIDRVGLDGASMREIAREAGCTTGSLTHHFAGRRELLTYAVGAVCEDSTARLVSTASGGGSLLEALAEYLPLDEARRLESVVWVVGVAEASRDPQMAAELARRSRVSNDLVAAALRERFRHEGRRADEDELALVVDEIVTGTDGIATSALCEPERFPPERQVELARRLLARMGLLDRPQPAVTSRPRAGREAAGVVPAPPTTGP